MAIVGGMRAKTIDKLPERIDAAIAEGDMGPCFYVVARGELGPALLGKAVALMWTQRGN